MSRGRPKEQEAIVWQKYTQEMLEVPSKPELGSRSVWHYDRSKFDRGPYKTEYFPAKGERQLKFKPEKGKAYGKQPVVLVFKTSNRSNAKIKMKVWKNENIDHIISQDKLTGVSSKAVMLELGVGNALIERYKQKYDLT
jgi:hypothetical protein|tara:strand:- start:41 stop:457 length:417 start_codon:yes stop_codon:yes gene_type:complete